MLAALTGTAELKIDKDESEILSRGIVNVARHYDVVAASQKTLDWFNLIQALAMVYGPRAFAISSRRKEKRTARKSAQAGNSHDAPQSGTGFDGNPVVIDIDGSMMQ